MIIDCGSCTARGAACSDCVVTFLTIPVRADEKQAPAGTEAERDAEVAGQQVDLDDEERRAIDLLARSGLVPPLRMRAV